MGSASISTGKCEADPFSWNYLEAGCMQALRRGIGSSSQVAFGGERVVDVGEDADDLTASQRGQFN